MQSKQALKRQKIWRLPEEQTPDAELLDVCGGSKILAALLMRRGIIDATSAEAFLDPAKYEPSSPMEFADMGKALVRIAEAIGRGEKICVYGDYDVDGVTATSVLYTTLKKLGANVDFYIPNRSSEGYGLNIKAVSILASKQRCKLIITCDCGISNFAEINLAKSLGVETIVVDHHSMPDVLPPAVAILHPKQLDQTHPLFHLPGVGVAYKLAEALLDDNNLSEETAKLHDFVTLGMIADMVPLVKENRYLVQIGLPALVNSERAGIKALLENTAKMEGSDIVGFGLAPRINAVGRLSDATLAVKLMTVEDEVEARELAQKLELENARRQELCEQIFMEADIKARQAFAEMGDSALAIYSPNWHHGVVGIVASRLVEKYHCPVFIAEFDEQEGKIKGSARGVSGIDLYQILKENEELMIKWGGHQMAAGFSAEAVNAELLCRGLVASCARALESRSKSQVLEIDMEIEGLQLDMDLVKEMRRLGPFGMWNKKPLFVMRGLSLLGSRALGKEGKHHRLMLQSKDKREFECVWWRSGVLPEEGNEIDLAFTAEINYFNNSERLQLVLSDWRGAGEADPAEEVDEQIDFSPEHISGENSLSAASVKASINGKAPESRETASADATDMPAKVLRLKTEYDGTNASSSVLGTETMPYEIQLGPNLSKQAQASTGLTAQEASRFGQLAAEVCDYSQEASRLAPDDFDLNSGLISGGADEDELLSGAALEPASPVSAMTPPANSKRSPDSRLNSNPNRSSDSKINSSSKGIPEPNDTGSRSDSVRSDSRAASGPGGTITIKDLRLHASPSELVNTAARKLQEELNIFAENCKLPGQKLVDRCMEARPHLFIWQFPPGMQAFRSLLARSGARQVYLCGRAETEELDALQFLKKLLAMLRYAVNQRDGQAPADKLCAGLATNKMALALGLTLLKKAEIIDWYAEDSMIYVDISGGNEGRFEDFAEFRQLKQTLKEITEFRNWCAEAALEEIQSELIPNSVRLFGESNSAGEQASQEGDINVSKQRPNNNDRQRYSSTQPRKG